MAIMEWFKLIVSGLISSAAVLGGIFFFAQESFKNILSRRLESFKHDLGVEATRRQVALQSQIQFKERQLSEFYGPTYALLRRIRPIDELWNAGKLQAISDAAVEVICDSNNRIADIILSKCHLIQGDKIPESYTHFLTHVAIWHAFLKSPLRGWPETPALPEAYYTTDFEKDIYGTTETLKRELYQLYQRYGLETNQDSL